MILAGDIGGTKTNLALFERGGPLVPVREATLHSRDFETFESAVAHFLSEGPRVPVDAASFGIAGPVVDGVVATTNLPWKIDERALEASIPARRVRLLNDLEAAGHGLAELPEHALLTLQPGQPRAGNRALIAAGTGLGEAMLIWDGTSHRVIASEGGHADFAPRTELEIELLRFLSAEFGRVSYERILSGPGFFNIYRFLRDTGRAAEPAWLTAQLAAGGDPGAIVGAAVLEKRDPLAAAALELFLTVYGAEAGNLALRTLAVGGVYLGGGIAPRFVELFAASGFLSAFRTKGRFTPLVEATPIRLVLEPRVALFGAAGVARTLA